MCCPPITPTLVCRSLDAHSCALTLVDSLCFQRVPTQFHDAVRPILTASMLFLSTFVHGNAKNQAAVWRQRSMLESCLGDGVGAEFVLAEVRLAVYYNSAVHAPLPTGACPPGSCLLSCNALSMLQCIRDNHEVVMSVTDEFFWELANQVEDRTFDPALLLPVLRSLKVLGRTQRGRSARCSGVVRSSSRPHVVYCVLLAIISTVCYWRCVARLLSCSLLACPRLLVSLSSATSSVL